MKIYPFSTALGEAAIAYEKDPFVLLRVYLPRKKANLMTAIRETSGETVRREALPAAVLPITEAIGGYLETGAPLPLCWEQLAMAGFTPLQQAVLGAVAAIPYGQVRAYGEIAAAVGRAKAARFVGNTVAQNPFPLLIPCHRVVRSSGAVGKFGGGAELKKRLLALEAAYLAG